MPRARAPEPPPPDDDLLALQQALRAIASRPRQDDGALLSLANGLAEHAQQVRLVLLDVLGTVEEAKAYRLEGIGTFGRWVSTLPAEVESKDVTTARRLGAYPVVREQLLDGRLSLASAQRLQAALTAVRPFLDRPDRLIDGRPGEETLRAVLVGGIRMMVAQARGGFPAEDDPVLQDLLTTLPEIADGPGTQLARWEAGLLVLAEHVEGPQLAGALGLLVDALLPDQLEARAARKGARRGLRLTRDSDGGGWHLSGDLDLECGERLFTALQSEMFRDPDNPVDTATAADLRAEGLDPYDPDLAPTLSPRSRAQRLHDALSNLCGRYLGAGLGGEHDKEPVQIAVTVSEDSLDGRPGALPARTASGTVVPHSLLRTWACDSVLLRLVKDLRGKVIAASHTQRTLTGLERKALHAQTGGVCQGAGCRSSTHDPGTVLHPHHTEPYAKSGTTSLSGTAHVCTSCHAHIHRGGILLLKDGRRLGPHGWVHGEGLRDAG